MSGFTYGAATLPLPPSMDNSLLRDADPAVYYSLEFFAHVIERHIGERLVAEATAAGAKEIKKAVAETIPFDPDSYITENHLKFPLLALHRENTPFRYLNTKRVGASRLKLYYVLPPLRVAQVERLLPALHAVQMLIDRKIVEGRDPTYVPTAPEGEPGESIWTKERAGVAKAVVRESVMGTFHISNELNYHAVVMTLEMWELTGDWGGDPFDGIELEGFN